MPDRIPLPPPSLDETTYVDRRERKLVRDGDRLTDETAVQEWINSMRAPRTKVKRLSEDDPTLQRPGR